MLGVAITGLVSSATAVIRTWTPDPSLYAAVSEAEELSLNCKRALKDMNTIVDASNRCLDRYVSLCALLTSRANDLSEQFIVRQAVSQSQLDSMTALVEAAKHESEVDHGTLEAMAGTGIPSMTAMSLTMLTIMNRQYDAIETLVARVVGQEEVTTATEAIAALESDFQRLGAVWKTAASRATMDVDDAHGRSVRQLAVLESSLRTADRDRFLAQAGLVISVALLVGVAFGRSSLKRRRRSGAR